jgi:cobalt-zinc-cadmium efflux system protein
MKEHDHDNHGHDHGHTPRDFGKAFAVGLFLNGAFVVIEVVYGVIGNSVALIADGGHNLSDALGLGVAWAAIVLGRRKPTSRFTYGLGGSSILAALFNAIFLLVVAGGLSWEAIQRFWNPEPVGGMTVIIVAACGIAINGLCAWLFASGRESDLNVRGAFIHMAADALVSLGVVVAGLIILLTGWLWIDPLMSLVINAVIIYGTWSLLAGSITMALHAVPSGIDLDKLKTFLLGLPGVVGINDLHVWSLSTTEMALTCHLLMPDGHPDDFTEQVAHEIEEQFGIGHSTIQIEKASSDAPITATHSH